MLLVQCAYHDGVQEQKALRGNRIGHGYFPFRSLRLQTCL